MGTKTAAIPLEMVSIDLLKPSKTNPRKRFDEHALNELAESIKKQGIVQPILVRKNGEGFEIVAGERRFRAAKIAGLEEAPVIIRELADQDVLEIQVIENLQRMDLHPLEEADGYRQLMRLPKPHSYDVVKISEHVGRSVKYVYDRIKLLDLVEPLKKDFSDGKITAGHAVILARLSAADQRLAADKNCGGLWQDEYATFDFGDGKGKGNGYKLRSVRELQTWVNDHCRFVAERDADQMLFPETAALIKSLDPKKKSDKIVNLATGYVQNTARSGGEKHISPASWKRADGKAGSKVCDMSVVGVVITGEERAKAFRVCIAKDKCRVHWAQRIKDRVARQKAAASGEGRTPHPKGPGAHEISQQEEMKRAAIEEQRWQKALPEILKNMADAFKKAPIAKVTEKLIAHLEDEWIGGDLEKAKKNLEIGKTSDEILRYVGYFALLLEMDNRMDNDDIIKFGKSLGIDVKKILDQAAPVQTSAEKPAKAQKKAKK